MTGRFDGRSPTCRMGLEPSATACSMAFSSSRTLPGQSYAIRRTIASSRWWWGPPFGSLNFSRNEFTRMECRFCAASRSGNSICTTFSRKKRSCRNCPWRTARSRPRLSRRSQTRRNRHLGPCRRRASLFPAGPQELFRSMGSSPISSRKRVPLSADCISLIFEVWPRRRALHVPEKLGLDQRGNQRRAIHGTNGPFAAGRRSESSAQPVSCPFRSRPGSGRGKSAGSLFHKSIHTLHRRRYPNQVAEAGSVRSVLQDPVFLVHFGERTTRSSCCAARAHGRVWSRSPRHPCASLPPRALDRAVLSQQ